MTAPTTMLEQPTSGPATSSPSPAGGARSCIALTLPYPISANRYWRAVTIGGRNEKARQIMAPTKEAKAYKEQCGWIAVRAGIHTPLDWRFELEIDLYPGLPQDWAKRQRSDPYWDDTVQCMDLGNCEKVLADALQGVVYTDDRWCWRQTKQRMVPDSKGARVELRVIPLVRTLDRLELQERLL